MHILNSPAPLDADASREEVSYEQLASLFQDSLQVNRANEQQTSSIEDNIQPSNVTVSNCNPRFMELIHSINTFASNGDAISQDDELLVALQAVVSRMEKLQVS